MTGERSVIVRSYPLSLLCLLRKSCSAMSVPSAAAITVVCQRKATHQYLDRLNWLARLFDPEFGMTSLRCIFCWDHIVLLVIAALAISGLSVVPSSEYLKDPGNIASHILLADTSEAQRTSCVYLSSVEEHNDGTVSQDHMAPCQSAAILNWQTLSFQQAQRIFVSAEQGTLVAPAISSPHRPPIA